MNKNNRGTAKFTIAALAITLAGCGGGSGSGGDSPGVDDTSKQTPQQGQALLGPVVGATVTIRDIEDLDTVACTTTTSDNDELADAGRISFNQPCIFGDHLYLVNVAGGNDIDYNDDGVRDASPTINNGEFRALLSGEQLLQGNWKATALTEVTYQAVQYALQLGETDLAAIVDDIAQQLLIQDVTADDVIDRFDIAQWHPVTHAAAVVNMDKLQFSTQLIHQNLNRTLAEIPDADVLAGRIDTLAPARQVLAYNDFLLVTTDVALLIYRVDGNSSTLVSSLALGWIYDMTLAQDALYIALGGSGIARVDLSDPAHPVVSERWPYHAQWLASVGSKIVFTTTTNAVRQSLMTIDENGVMQQVLEDEYVAAVSAVDRDRPLLENVGDVVYWAPFSAVKRLTLQQESWQELPALEVTNSFAVSRNVRDIEVIGSKVIVVGNSRFLSGPPRAGGQMVDANLVEIYDVSDSYNPIWADTASANDFNALHYVNGDLIGIGDNTISLRSPEDLSGTASLLLPESFSGFYPIRGVSSIGGLLAIAARENGVLLLSTSDMPLIRYTGKAMLRGPVSGARAIVRDVAANAVACESTTTNEGVISIPAGCIIADTLYDVDISGGTHLYDGMETPLQGRMHALMYKENFERPDWIVSHLSTLVFDMSLANIQNPDISIFRWDFSGITRWWQNSSTSTYDELIHTQPYPQVLIGSSTAEQNENAITQLQNGTWNGDHVLLSLTGASNYLIMEYGSDEAVANQHNLFVASGQGIQIFTSAAKPQKIAHISGNATSIVVDAEVLAVTDWMSDEVRLYDITDAGTPYLRRTYDFPENALMGNACLSTTHAFIMEGDMLHAYRFADNGLLAIADMSGHRSTSQLDQCRENQAYLVDYDGGDVEIVTAGNTGVTWQSLPTTGSRIAAVARAGDNIVLALDDGALQKFTRQASGSFVLTVQAPAATTFAADNFGLIAAGEKLVASDNVPAQRNSTAQIIDLETLHHERYISLAYTPLLAANSDFIWHAYYGLLFTYPLQ